MPLDIALRDKLLLAGGRHGNMNMRRATGIGYRLDRAKTVLAGAAGQKATEALKMRVAFVGVSGFGMQVRATTVALPNFDYGVANRIPGFVENAPREMRDFTDCRRERIVDDK